MGDRPARVLILLAAVASLLPNVLVATGHASHDARSRRCFGERATIMGTHGSDVILGTSGSDVIVAFDGDDEVYGRGGSDAICSGAGDDVSHGGPGFDAVAGGEGADHSFGGAGADFVAEDHGVLAVADAGSDSSADLYEGGPGDDMIADDAGADALHGGGGRDTFFGLFPYDPLVVDLAHGRAASVAEVNALTGIENVIGSLSTDVIVGDDGPNVLTGLFGSDVVIGNRGADLLMATVDGDVLDGGDGAASDAVFAVVNEPVEADLQEGLMTAGDGQTDRLVGVEDFIGTPRDDVVRGSDAGNRLYGGTGDDLLAGRAGDDAISGDHPFVPWIDPARWLGLGTLRGEDLLIGGRGTDALDGGPAHDTCRGGETLRRCESRRGDRARPVAARANLWDPAPAFGSWILDALTAASPEDVTPPRWTPRGLR
ncbi:MAG: hypothetical protein ABR613_12375 [Actinomycetota bacterium]